MPNPILEQINNRNGTTIPQQPQPQQTPTDAYVQQLKQITQSIKNSANPQMMLQNAIMQNPNLKQAMSLIQSMKSPEQALTMLAQQKGLNPTQIMEVLKTL